MFLVCIVLETRILNLSVMPSGLMAVNLQLRCPRSGVPPVSMEFLPHCPTFFVALGIEMRFLQTDERKLLFRALLFLCNVSG